MDNYQLRFRQVHLDFHTSEHIGEVGLEFDAEAFAETLERAHVDSVTCFARCHHGWLYYDSKRFPDLVHPQLKTKDLLRAQIEACHRKNIRVPIYLTVQWDHKVAREHPEWLIVDEKGATVGGSVFEPGFYHSLCVNTPYRDYLKEITADVCMSLPVDGLFFDIVYSDPCCCQYCQAKMAAKGLEPSNMEHRKQFSDETMREFMRDMSAFVRSYQKECSLFYNRSHVGIFQRDVVAQHSHFELESLPSGGWGYMHFPVTIRYARTLGLDCLGQTGKFHTEWGDFHSFKNKEALAYECYRMLSFNAKCMIGDQMEPAHKLSELVYERIGEVYGQIEQREPWLQGATPVTEIAVLNPEEFGEEMMPAIIGVTRMLEEGGHQFDIIDSRQNFCPYKLLVLPDHIPVSDDFAKKLSAYVEAGGSVIASYESGLNAEQTSVSWACLGIKLLESITRTEAGNPARGQKYERNNYADYLLPQGTIAKGLHETEYVMYMKGMEVEVMPGSEVLANAILPYFNRTYKHFCSHLQAPSSGQAGYRGIVKNGTVIYFAHPIFSQYDQNAPSWCKKLFLNAVEMLLPEPLVKHEGPSSMLVTLNEQKEQRRYLLHLLHYIPQRKSKDIDIIEDVIPIHQLKISVKLPKEIHCITCVPEGETLTFDKRTGRVDFTVPVIKGYQIIELAYL